MSRRSDAGAGPSGICVVDKPPGWTSHDVVGRTRRLLGTRRVGHAGTLDPMATGVLVLGVGRATRLLTFITGVDKTYDAELQFGVETDTLDADGEVTARHDMSGLDPAEVLAAARSLTGDILQVPPMVSALKVGGRRLHEIAREGGEVDRAPRPVTVSRLELEPTDDPMVWRAGVDCSSGTYVRTLAADLGRALGGGAHLRALRRTAVGPFGLGEARPVDDPVLLDPVEGVRHLPRVDLDAGRAAEVVHGRKLAIDTVSGSGSDTGPWAVVGPGGDLLAVYVDLDGSWIKPAVVLAPAGSG